MRSVMEVLVEKAAKQAEDTAYAVFGAVINGLDDDEIRDKYGARQDLIDRVRALLKKN